MPHLYLPAEHSDTDLVLAADVAAAVGSEDLYVAWSHETGPGAVPEIEAIVRDQPPRYGLGMLISDVLAGIAAIFRGLFRAPAKSVDLAPAATADPRAAEPSS
jgi:hypothetical protein